MFGLNKKSEWMKEFCMNLSRRLALLTGFMSKMMLDLATNAGSTKQKKSIKQKEN